MEITKIFTLTEIHKPKGKSTTENIRALWRCTINTTSSKEYMDNSLLANQ